MNPRGLNNGTSLKQSSEVVTSLNKENLLKEDKNPFEIEKYISELDNSIASLQQ